MWFEDRQRATASCLSLNRPRWPQAVLKGTLLPPCTLWTGKLLLVEHTRQRSRQSSSTIGRRESRGRTRGRRCESVNLGASQPLLGRRRASHDVDHFGHATTPLTTPIPAAFVAAAGKSPRPRSRSERSSTLHARLCRGVTQQPPRRRMPILLCFDAPRPVSPGSAQGWFNIEATSTHNLAQQRRTVARKRLEGREGQARLTFRLQAAAPLQGMKTRRIAASSEAGGLLPAAERWVGRRGGTLRRRPQLAGPRDAVSHRAVSQRR